MAYLRIGLIAKGCMMDDDVRLSILKALGG